MKYLNPKKLLLAALLGASISPITAQHETVIRQFLKDNCEQMSLTAQDVNDWVVYDQHHSKQSGVDYVYIRQRHQGIEVFNAIANFSLKDGKVIGVGNRFEAKLASRVNTMQASISPQQAIEKAAEQLNLTISTPLRALEPVSAQHFIFTQGGISKENIPVKLMFQPGEEGEILLAWDLSIYETNAQHWWSVRVDAQSGKIISKMDWVKHCEFPEGGFGRCSNPTHHHDVAPIPSPNTTLSSTALPDQYRVFAEPLESPNHGPRTLRVDPKDSLASPYGWHDTNGSAGPEYTITRGNNVFAYEDADNDDAPGYSPDGTAAMNFDFTLNLNQAPSGYQDAAITNLFYWNNLMHDLWYQYGFDEASGNFQQNNYGRGGTGADYVFAEAQDGGGTNNANFATPTDGSNGRMQMYLWTGGAGISNMLTVNTPSGIAGQYTASEAGFGPGVPSTPITADVVLVQDGTAPSNDACSALTNGAAISGKIAILYRGTCNFTTKVANAQAAGAIAVIVINNVAGAPIAMGGTDPSITIPSIMISDVDGATLMAQITAGQTVNATIVNNSGNFDKDGDFDNGIIAHEYGHGISTRLTGGPSNSNCLNNSEQMGEGWSDFFGMIMTMRAGDSATLSRGVGTYATGATITGNGIRNAPYTTNMTVNPYTYADVNDAANVSEPHGIGFVWCTMLWDLNWAMIDQYGWDSNLFTGTGGNNMTMQLVIEGLKLQPCSPGFVDGRDAILRADSILYGGANQCLIWEVFARRGLGYSADQGSSSSRSDQTEAFDLPPLCAIPTVAPTAAFSNTLASSCGGTVYFDDQSTNTPQTWNWNFGDGNSSTQQNPTHIYNNNGTYTVTLIVTNTLGSDTSTMTVSINMLTAPSVGNATICSGQSATLNGTASGNIIWYDASGTNPLDTGLAFTTPVLTNNTTYMAENVTFFPSQNIGPLDGSIGAGGYHNSAFIGTQNFTAYKACTIISAWADAGAAGNRTFYLWQGSNGNGTVVDSVVVNIAAGQQRVSLNLEVPAPGNYCVGSSNVNLFRNTAGASYPYTISGLLSITSSSATTNPQNYWYYLYDWEVQEAPCRSPKVPATVTVSGANFSYVPSGLNVQFTDLSVGGTSWAWDFGDGNTSTAQNPAHSYAAAGSYTVTLVVNGNTTCPYTMNIVINASGVTTVDPSLAAVLNPNPGKGQTSLQFNTALTEDVLVQIMSVEGRILQETMVRAGERNKELDLSRLVPAMYLVRLSNAKGTQTLKLTVK